MADKLTDLDTGTGGFKIPTTDADGTAQVYKSLPKGQDDTADPVLWDGGNVNVDIEQRDLPKKTKETLANYLGKLTKGQSTSISTRGKNYYSVDADSVQEVTNQRITTSTNTEQFNKNIETLGSQWQYSSSQVIKVTPGDKKLPNQNEPGSSPALKLRNELPAFSPGAKDRIGSSVVNGHGLLQKAAEVNSPVARYSSALMTNRFNNDIRFPDTDNVNKLRFLNTKYEMGTSVGQGKQISYGQMTQVGSIIMARSSYEVAARENNQSLSSRELLALIPSVPQLGATRVLQSQLEARNVLEQIADSNEDTVEKDTRTIEISKNSWGSMFSNFETFSGIGSVSTALLSAALVIGTSILLEIFAYSIGLIMNVAGYKIPSDGAQKMLMGSSYVTKPNVVTYTSEKFLKDFLVMDPIFSGKEVAGKRFPRSMGECVTEGLKYLYVPSESTTRNLTSFFSGGQAGYYVTISRAVVRSFTRLIEIFTDGFSAGNPILNALQLIETILAIGESKFMRMLNMIVQIGDRSFLGENSPEIHKKYELADNSHDKIRLDPEFNGDKTLAYSLRRSKDVYITNSNFEAIRAQGLTLDIGAPQSVNPNAKDKFQVITQDKGNRISDEQRITLEKELDSEYVPFYFHDLRTNEFLQFHAFLTSLEDSYTANYDTSEGIGRIDPVKIYKNTSRKLGVSFILAATDKQDFQYMWHKINKLTTLVYPQYSEGKQITDFEAGKFKMNAPFSQMIQASPMVRLRIGDLIKSNYSKFDLARLFGLGSPGTQFDNNPIPTAGINDPKKVDRIRKEIHFDTSKNLTYRLNGAGSEFTFIDGVTRKMNKAVVFKIKTVEDYIDRIQLIAYVDPNSSGASAAEVAAILNPPAAPPARPSPRGKTTVAPATPDPPAATNYWGDIGEEASVSYLLEAPSGEIFSKFISQFTLTEDGQKVFDIAFAARASEMTLDNNESVMKSYFDAGKNVVDGAGASAVAKSFESVGGKGLPGFIESLSFAWLDQTTWAGVGSADRDGNIAPKMCKISIGFAPIHDISPGIDASGVNRAPVYRVGPYNIR